MTVRAPIAISIALLVGALAFWPSLAAVVRTASTSTATGVAMLLPIVGICAAIAAIMRGGPAKTLKLEPAMLGAVPLLLAAVLLMTVGPARLGFDFWRLRLDLVAWICFTFALLFLVTGVRATTRHGAMFVALGTLPPLTLPLIRWIEGPLTSSMRAAADKIAIALPLGVHKVGDGLFENGERQLVAIASACAGVDALGVTLGAALVAAVAMHGRSWRKIALAVGALVVLWLGNVMRTTMLLAVAGANRMGIFDVVHAVSGLLIVALVCGGMVIAARRMGLGMELKGMRGHRITATRTHVVTTIIATTIALGGIGLGNYAYAEEGLGGAGVDSTVRLSHTGDAKGALVLDVPGWNVRADVSYPWLKALFGDASQASSFTMLRESEAPVWVQVISSPSRRKLDKYAPLDCYVAHGAKVVRVRRVELPGGAGILVDQRLRGHAFSALSWSQPAQLPNGDAGHVRLVLMTDAFEGRDQEIPAADGAVERAAFGVMNVLAIAPDKDPKGVAYGPSGRRLIGAARSMLDRE